jgi:hypothetical protein
MKFTIELDGQGAQEVLVPAGATAAEVAALLNNATGGRVTILTPEEEAHRVERLAAYAAAERQRLAEREAQIVRLIGWASSSAALDAGDSAIVVRALEILRDAEAGDL